MINLYCFQVSMVETRAQKRLRQTYTLLTENAEKTHQAQRSVEIGLAGYDHLIRQSLTSERVSQHFIVDSRLCSECVFYNLIEFRRSKIEFFKSIVRIQVSTFLQFYLIYAFLFRGRRKRYNQRACSDYFFFIQHPRRRFDPRFEWCCHSRKWSRYKFK
jgi:hypothetical protein